MLKVIFASGFLAAGFGMAVIGLVSFLKKRAKLARCDRFSGEVIDVKEYPAEDAPFRHPVIRYQTLNGDEVTFESKYGRPHWKIQVGDPLQVVVNRLDPTDTEVASLMSLWRVPMGCAAMAVMLLGSAAVVYISPTAP